MTPQPGQRVMHDAQRDPAQSSLGVEVLGLGAGFHSWTIAVQRLRRIKGIPRNSSVAKGRLGIWFYGGSIPISVSTWKMRTLLSGPSQGLVSRIREPACAQLCI